jgi:glycosyltransferase involved in cell wall biosynthesis
VDLSVIIPTHNPNRDRLRRTLLGLRAQTLPGRQWETLLVNNASTDFPAPDDLTAAAPDNLTVLEEPVLGLTAARRRGFAAAQGRYWVMVDDDNVLAADYLCQCVSIFEANPRLGAIGGKSLPEFESPPPAWAQEFLGLLALRDLGSTPLVSRGLRSSANGRNEYPLFAPIGAGMALRQEAARVWLDRAPKNGLTDRRGTSLSSSGDNDIVLSLMHAGWEVGYFPQLSLQHLIPRGRLEASYLERLNRSLQESWQQVLMHHGTSPWQPLSRSGATLRKIRAWFTYRAWTSPAARIRWKGACGHFAGRVKMPRAPDRKGIR